MVECGRWMLLICAFHLQHAASVHVIPSTSETQDTWMPLRAGTSRKLSGQLNSTALFCSVGTFQMNETCQECAQNHFSNESGLGECHACEEGSFSEEGAGRCGCAVGQYSRVALGDVAKCLDCRVRKWCLAGTDAQTANCAGAGCTQHESRCIEGRRGIGCVSCSQGYYNFNSDCLKCESKTENSARWLLLVPVVLFCVLLHRISRKLHKERTEVRLHAILLLSTMLTTFTWLQTATFITKISVTFHWPAEVVEFSAIVGGLANLDLASYTNIACRVDQGELEAHQWLLIELACLTLLLVALYLFNLFITSCLAFLWCCKCDCGWAYRFAEQFQHLLITLFILLYLAVVSKITEVFNCPGGYLSIKPDTACDYSNLGYQTMAIFAIGLLLLLGFGPLVFIYQKLDSARRRGKLDDPEFCRINGLLYLPYRPKYFYFQVVIMCRKLAIVLATNVLSTQPVFQIVGIVFVVALALYVQIRARPFVSPQQDDLEKMELLSTLILIIVGLISYSKLLDGSIIVVLVTAIYLLTCLYILYFVWLLVFSFEAPQHSKNDSADNKFLYASNDHFAEEGTDQEGDTAAKEGRLDNDTQSNTLGAVETNKVLV